MILISWSYFMAVFYANCFLSDNASVINRWYWYHEGWLPMFQAHNYWGIMLFLKRKIGKREIFINLSSTNDHFTSVTEGIQTQHLEFLRLSSYHWASTLSVGIWCSYLYQQWMLFKYSDMICKSRIATFAPFTYNFNQPFFISLKLRYNLSFQLSLFSTL